MCIFSHCILCKEPSASKILVAAGPRPGPHLLPGRRPEGEGSAADAADVLGPDRLGHRPHAAQDGPPRHLRRLLAAPRSAWR